MYQGSNAVRMMFFSFTSAFKYVQLRDSIADTVVSSTGAPQGTVLSPVLFVLYTSDFKYNSELCHMSYAKSLL